MPARIGQEYLFRPAVRGCHWCVVHLRISSLLVECPALPCPEHTLQTKGISGKAITATTSLRNGWRRWLQPAYINAFQPGAEYENATDINLTAGGVSACKLRPGKNEDKI